VFLGALLRERASLVRVFPRDLPASRYELALLRRRALRSLAAAGVVASVTACGNADDTVFDGAAIAAPTTTPASTVPDSTMPTSTGPTSTDPTPTMPASTVPASTTAPPATVATSSDVTASVPTTSATANPQPSPGSLAFPAGGELLVDFTFSPTSSGERIRNPYIAVWVEDLDGNLIDTISLWYNGNARDGTRWLRTLRQWSDATDEAIDPTSSGATRPAGSYTVAWDGADADGQPIAPGTYRLFVEAAREDGPYELTSADVVFSGQTFAVSLPDDGELSAVSARLVA